MSDIVKGVRRRPVPFPGEKCPSCGSQDVSVTEEGFVCNICETTWVGRGAVLTVTSSAPVPDVFA